MSSPVTVKQADAVRIISAARKAGLKRAKIRFVDGTELSFDETTETPARGSTEIWGDDDV